MSLNLVFSDFYNIVVDNAGDVLEENPKDYKELCDYIASRELHSLSGKTDSTFKSEIDGITYISDNALMNWFRFDFKNDKATLTYKNDRGEMSIDVGFGYNEFQKFPQTGYSDVVASIPVEGHMYECACSAEWADSQKLLIVVQIIDKYFGKLKIGLSFKDNLVQIEMIKAAEAFLFEYDGKAKGEIK